MTPLFDSYLGSLNPVSTHSPEEYLSPLHPSLALVCCPGLRRDLGHLNMALINQNSYLTQSCSGSHNPDPEAIALIVLKSSLLSPQECVHLSILKL